MVKKVLSELFYSFRAQQNLDQQDGFLDPQTSQCTSRLDWSHDKFCQSLYENPCPKLVCFVSQTMSPFLLYNLHNYYGDEISFSVIYLALFSFKQFMVVLRRGLHGQFVTDHVVEGKV